MGSDLGGLRMSRLALLCEHDSLVPHTWTLLDSEMSDGRKRVQSCPGGMVFEPDDYRRVWWCDRQMSIGIQLDHSKHDECGLALLVPNVTLGEFR